MPAPCPTCQPIECDTTPDANLYSLQTPVYPFVLFCPPGFNCQPTTSFTMLCCNQIVSVTFPPGASLQLQQSLIQSVVNQCAAILPSCGQTGPKPCPNPPCPPPTTIFQNTPQTCTVPCPDGTLFSFTTPAGMFGDLNQNNANKLASNYACQQAGLRKVCLGPLVCAACRNSAFAAPISTTGGVAPFTWSVSAGALPPGVTLNTSTGVISGTPSISGNFLFSITVTEAGGGTITKGYSISVLDITTTSLPLFIIGTPYSFQLQAAGGSGSYNWKISSGALPTGLTLSLTGLISGTPTALGTNPITFTVIDTACDTADKSFFQPLITLTTKSTTQVATVLGWSEMPGFVSSPPKKFMSVLFTGTSEQQLWYQGMQIGGAKYDFAGSSDTIDQSGNITSTHTKTLSLMCNGAQNRANLVGGIYPQNTNFSLAAPFLGYFGTNSTFYSNLFGPTELCSSASNPYQTFGNEAGNTPFSAVLVDAFGLWGSSSAVGLGNVLGPSLAIPTNNTTASANDIGTTSVGFNPYAFPLNPPGVILEAFSSLQTPIGVIPRPPDWNVSATIIFNNVFSVQLQNEYTDSIALANAKVIVGNGSIALNNPRTTGFVSTFTNVVYTLSCSGLITGQNYTVSVDFADLTAGTVTTLVIPISATGATQSIVNTVPTPISGHSVQVRNPRITFA